MGQDRVFDEGSYPDQQLSGEIIGAFYFVYHRFGYGFLESVYRKALAVELKHRGIAVAEEVQFELAHRDVTVGIFRADLIAGGRVIVETKAGTVLDPAASAQLLNYLAATRSRLGLVLHFGPRPAVKRLIFTAQALQDVSSDAVSEREKAKATETTGSQKDAAR